ncbi:hypothetical protein PPTG_22297 [Phytophthora nicotianae INRA-310]|uniref:Uncharacterized protein n=1 Tax=Phytophthora nicotianae (strain INRA-310) TaxID=761204 RepID=W2QLI2_PHYN3|nr:hypothetical protein PPTG_22297 [Phytophthora nicotianae INRA-310]ETN14037.1 hypothetical protein PPTG_22297 [Phytophthora nicotianae INRA-310]
MSTERVSMCYLKETYKEYENVKVKQLPEVDDFGALREGGSPNLFTKQHIGLVLQYAAVGIVYGFLQHFVLVGFHILLH